MCLLKVLSTINMCATYFTVLCQIEFSLYQVNPEGYDNALKFCHSTCLVPDNFTTSYIKHLSDWSHYCLLPAEHNQPKIGLSAHFFLETSKTTVLQENHRNSPDSSLAEDNSVFDDPTPSDPTQGLVVDINATRKASKILVNNPAFTNSSEIIAQPQIEPGIFFHCFI